MTHYIENAGNRIPVSKAKNSLLIPLLRSVIRVALLPGITTYCATREELDNKLPSIIISFDERGYLEFWADILSTEIKNRGIKEPTISIINN